MCLCVCGLLLQLYYSVHCYYIGDPLEQERCLREATQASLANLVRTQAVSQEGREQSCLRRLWADDRPVTLLLSSWPCSSTRPERHSIAWHAIA